LHTFFTYPLFLGPGYHVNFSPEDPCCHGNQPFLFKDKIGCRLTRASNAETQLLGYIAWQWDRYLVPQNVFLVSVRVDLGLIRCIYLLQTYQLIFCPVSRLTAGLVVCYVLGQQSSFIRQWNHPPLSCAHQNPTPSATFDACAKAKLFDVEPLGAYTNDCHVALEVCHSVHQSVCLSVSLCV